MQFFPQPTSFKGLSNLCAAYLCVQQFTDFNPTRVCPSWRLISCLGTLKWVCWLISKSFEICATEAHSNDSEFRNCYMTAMVIQYLIHSTAIQMFQHHHPYQHIYYQTCDKSEGVDLSFLFKILQKGWAAFMSMSRAICWEMDIFVFKLLD